MSPTILVLASVIFFKPSHGYNENAERINDGASTSQELTPYEQCELWSYVDNIVRLITAEDIEASNLTDLMNNRFHELEAFHEEVFSNLLLAEYGAQFIFDAERRTERIEYVIYYTTMKLLEIIVESCMGHRRLKLEYSYDPERNVIILKEDTSFSSDYCLCRNYEERRTLSEELSLPAIERPWRTVQVDMNENEVSMIETVQYHVIPLSMLSKFFQLWLSDDLDPSSTDYNRCVLLLC